MTSKDARDLGSGFYENPETRLTQVASEALAYIYRQLGFDLETVAESKTRAAIFIMQLSDDSENLGEEVGGAFAGFTSPHEMIQHVLTELSSMATQSGVPMSVEVVDGPSSFSQN